MPGTSPRLKSKNRRLQKAVAVLELVLGLMILIPAIIVLIDLVMINMAIQVNDQAAREAVRVAAAGAPQTAASRAQRVLDRLSQTTKGYASGITLVSLAFSPEDIQAKEAALVPYGGMVQGVITVNTKVNVASVLASMLFNAPVSFQTSQSCPVTYTVPNTAGGQEITP